MSLKPAVVVTWHFCNIPNRLTTSPLFSGGLQEHPGYHTFHMDLVEGFPETRGISEGTFWNCAERSKARSYLGGLAHYSTGKALAERAAEEKKLPDLLFLHWPMRPCTFRSFDRISDATTLS